ncbi:helix-turn-helix domain-containing protein [Paenibacillus lautus]|uniref:helix-turn-helix domain-containing protein n=1 Tax=Paenibacillus lautus TaxID=1401 RepID=UPI001C116161|nr:helix-turn-helix domain-containing protein [Paenibacillus lautus]MBU5344500.1 helix-turn-helix domain-containing protein [Paenibacillus lautus]
MISIPGLLPGKRKSSRGRVLKTMIVSYMLILLLPMTVGLFLYGRVENVMENNAERSNSAMLEQLRLSVDSKLKEVDILAKQIMFNSKLTYLLNLDRHDQGGAYRQVEFVRDYLNRYQSFVSGFVRDYYVHLQAGDVILKPGLRTDARTFYDKYYRFEHMDFETWKRTMLGSYHNKAFLPSDVLLQNPNQGNGNPADVITYAQSLPLHDVSNIRGTLVIMIDGQQLQEMFRQIESANDSEIYILDKERGVIASSSDSGLSAQVTERLAGPSGLFKTALNGTDSMVTFTESKEAGWQYVSVMPMGSVMERVAQLKRMALTVFVVSLVAGAAVACWFAYRQYSPVKRVVDAILQGKPIQDKPAANEYDFILQTIEGSLVEQRHLRERLFRQTPVIRADFLSRLIRGYIDPDHAGDQGGPTLATMGIHFESDKFAVIIVQAVDITRLSPEPSEQGWTQIRFIISNIGTDIANSGHQGFAVDMERDRVAILVNFHPVEEAEAELFLHEIAERLLRVLEDRFHISVTIAVSSVHTGNGTIGSAYLEAMAALDYRMFSGRNSIIHFGHVRDIKHHYYYPIEFETQLVNHVRGGDTENVAKLLDNIYTMNFKSAGMTPELGRCLFFNIISTFLKILNLTNTDHESLLGPSFDPVKHIFGCSTSDEMQAETKRLYDKLTCLFHTEHSDHSIQLQQDMMAFIDRNLTDYNLGLGMIADHFGMTPQYISSFFKKMNRCNITDYITRARIEKAKTLMEQSELTNAQLAQLVGYTNDVVFIRAFKKLEGVTPGKYRVSASGQ